jgi:hypothetical protein
MATLNFPTSPSVNQTYTIGDQTWIWTGSAWIKLTSSPQTPIVINTVTQSTSTVTGSVVITGGLGVGGSVNIGTTSTIAGAQIITTATLNNYVNQPVIAAGTDTAVSSYVSSATEYVLVWNTSTLQTVTDRGNVTNHQLNITNQTNATNTTTGALIVGGGGAIGGDLWLGGTLYSRGVPVITTSSLIESITAGPDIVVTSTQGYTTGSIAITISDISTLDSVTGRGSTTTHAVTFQNHVSFTDTTESTSSSTGAVVISGGLGVAKRINSESIQIADTIMDSGQVLVNTTDLTIVDAYPVSQYRSAKYLIQISEAGGTGGGASFETIEILLLVDDNKTVYATEYAVLSTNGELGEFAADVQNDNVVRLYFTAYQATNKTLKIFRTGMTV